jgi:hypothetical protein
MELPAFDIVADLRQEGSELGALLDRTGIAGTLIMDKLGLVTVPPRVIDRWGFEDGGKTVVVGLGGVAVAMPRRGDKPPAVQAAVDYGNRHLGRIGARAENQRSRLGLPRQHRQAWGVEGQKAELDRVDVGQSLLFAPQGTVADAVGRAVPDLSDEHKDGIVADLFANRGQQLGGPSLLRGYASKRLVQGAFPEVYGSDASDPGAGLAAQMNRDAGQLDEILGTDLPKRRVPGADGTIRLPKTATERWNLTEGGQIDCMEVGSGKDVIGVLAPHGALTRPNLRQPSLISTCYVRRGLPRFMLPSAVHQPLQEAGELEVVDTHKEVLVMPGGGMAQALDAALPEVPQDCRDRIVEELFVSPGTQDKLLSPLRRYATRKLIEGVFPRVYGV